MRLSFASLLAAVALSGTGSAGIAIQDVPLTIGLLRHDGILTPIAGYEKGGWVDVWPKPKDGVPTTLQIETDEFWPGRRLSTPSRWFAAAESRPLELNVLTKVVHDEYCEYQVGLLTDRQRLTVDGFERRLAFTQPLAVDMPADIEDSSLARGGWTDLIDRIADTVLRQEAAALGAPPPAERAPLEIRRLYASNDDGNRLLYYEAARPIGKRGTPGATSLVVSGFVGVDRNRQPVSLSYRAWVAEAEYEHSGSIRPLGIITVDGRRYWVVRDVGYEGEGVSVIQTSPVLALAFRKHIGGC